MPCPVVCDLAMTYYVGAAVYDLAMTYYVGAVICDLAMTYRICGIICGAGYDTEHIIFPHIQNSELWNTISILIHYDFTSHPFCKYRPNTALQEETTHNHSMHYMCNFRYVLPASPDPLYVLLVAADKRFSPWL